MNLDLPRDTNASKVAMPLATSIALFAMVATAGLICVNFVNAMINAIRVQSGAALLVVLTFALAFSVVLPLVAAWALRSGRRWASVVATVVGGWSILQLTAFTDLVTWLSALVGVVAVVAVWMPSARAYGFAKRSERLQGLR